jgi:hypothetical protein
MKRQRTKAKQSQGPEVALQVSGDPGDAFCREIAELLADLIPSEHPFEVEAEKRVLPTG